jgi:assimilatory nitrate reductase catalytic subunit
MNEPLRTTCPYCGVGCGLLARRDSRGVHLAGDPDHPANRGLLCGKGAALAETLDSDGRLLYPQIHGRRVSWDTALDAVAAGFKRVIRKHGPEAVAFYVSGQLLTEDYYVANKLMKGFIGSANIDTNSRLCMSSAVAGHLRAFGEDIVPGCYDDFEYADLIVLAGANSAWCHPVLFQRIQSSRARRPEQRLVVIDPRRTATAEQADLHLAIRPGSDVLLFNGLLRYLDENNCTDDVFLRSHVTGADAALASLRNQQETVADTARCCGLREADILCFYRWFADHPRVVTGFSQGVNQSTAGTDKVNAIINCHLLTGRFGKPGTGPFSLTGQPNAMGGREVGALASTLAAHMDFAPDNVERLRRFWNSPAVAAEPGLKAVDLFRAAAKGRIRALWIMATNPAVSLPDAEQVRRALTACELVIVSDCVTHTDTTRHATILLPASAWGEKDGTVTNSERCISRQRAFLEAPGEARPDWWIITEAARRMGYGAAFPYQHAYEIFIEHARLSAFENNGCRLFNIGALANLSRAEYDAFEPLQWPVTHAKRRGTDRLYTEAGFQTADGRARMHGIRHKPPSRAPTAAYPLILNTGRARDHWHSMTRSGKSPKLSGHTPEPFVAVHPEDALELSLVDGELAGISTQWGRAVARVRVDAGQRKGEIFTPIHWSDQFASQARIGALVNPEVDPYSGEPEFKHTPARVWPWTAAWHGFLISRLPVAPGRNAGIDYWTRVREKSGWRLELAGCERRDHWTLWARRLLGAVGPDADWLEFHDAGAGNYRAARIDGGHLAACLCIAASPAALPPREWLGALLDQPGLQTSERVMLLAGCPPSPDPDPQCSYHRQ